MIISLMLKYLYIILTILSLCFCCILVNSVSFAQNLPPQSTEIFNYDSKFLGKDMSKGLERGVTDFTGNIATGEGQFRYIVETVLDYFIQLGPPIVILLLLWGGVEMIINRDKGEEELTAKKNMIFAVIIGFSVIFIAPTLIDGVFFGTEGEIFREDSSLSFAIEGGKQIDGLVNFITTFMVILSLIIIIKAGFVLIANSETEEAIGNAKKQIVFAILGIAVILSIKEFVDGFFIYDKKYQSLVLPNAMEIIRIILQWSKYILGMIAFFAVIALVWGGVQLVLFFGDDEKINNSKKIIQGGLFGLVVSISALTIVFYFLSVDSAISI